MTSFTAIVYSTAATDDYNVGVTTTHTPNIGEVVDETTCHYDIDGYDDDYEYDEFIYQGYSFERPVYMYIWPSLVLITVIANVTVICVLLQKKMRSSTNMILAAIAVSDSLTGLVTLPAHWAVYTTFNKPPPNYDQCSFMNDTSTNVAHRLNTTAADYNLTDDTGSYDNSENDIKEGYFLTASTCRAFMISTFFLSKTFHAVSIWLTLFLGFQRYISVTMPFRAKELFRERNVLLVSCVIVALAPLLHVYHLLDEKAEGYKGMCQWDLEKHCGGGGCAYLIIAFLLRHFIPCLLLVIFTILFIIQLTRSATRLNRMNSTSSKGNVSMQLRDSENRRASLIVTLIVIVFLIPELPYGCFLLYALIAKLNGSAYDLETNRAIHLVYMVSLVLSFHANFYIYTLFNKRFRRALLKGIGVPMRACSGTLGWICRKRRGQSGKPNRSYELQRTDDKNFTEGRTSSTSAPVQQKEEF